MATFESLESLLAEALQCLDESAGMVRSLEQLETASNLRRLGHAINCAWEIREEIHRLRPDLKPPFVLEYEQDKMRYEQLSEIAREAKSHEDKKELSQASALYSKLYTASGSGYFRMQAEAGLFRLSSVKTE